MRGPVIAAMSWGHGPSATRLLPSDSRRRRPPVVASPTRAARICILAILGAALVAGLSHTGAVTSCDLDVEILSPETGEHLNDTVSITWDKTGSDASTATSEVRLLQGDDLLETLASALDDESTTLDTRTIPDGGDYRIEVEVSNLCGSATDTTGEIPVDNTDPADYAFDRPKAGAVVGGDDVPIAWSGNETNPGQVLLEVSDDGGASWTTLTTSAVDDGDMSLDLSELAEGSGYRLGITPTDEAGNVGPSNTTGDFTIDHTPPTVQLDAPQDGERLAQETDIVWEALDANPVSVKIQVSRTGEDSWETIRSGLENDGKTTWTTTAQRDGRYDLRTVAVDAAGHQAVSRTLTVTINHHRPQVAFTQPAPGAQVAKLPAVLEGSASDPHLPIQRVAVQMTAPNGYHWDASEGTWTQAPVWNPATAPTWSVPLGPGPSSTSGPYSIAVRAEDTLGETATWTSKFLLETAMDAHNQTTETVGDASDRQCRGLYDPTATCEKVSEIAHDPSALCGTYNKQVQTDSGVGRGKANAHVESGGSAEAEAGTRTGCAGVAWALANLCSPTGGTAASACDGVVGLWTETGADYLDVSCRNQGSDWTERKLRSGFGEVQHRAAVGFETGTVSEVAAEWSGWENEQLICYNATDGLRQDLGTSPKDDFPEADVCSESAFEIETRGRFSGDTTDVGTAEITFTVPRSCTGQGGKPTLYHYLTHPDEQWQEGWEALPATRIGSEDGRPLYTAETGSFSPFVFGRQPDAGNALPEASLSVTCDGLNCTLDGSSSSDEDGWIVDHEWDLGDGSLAVGATVNHSYPEPGVYNVVLTVRDDADAEDRTNRTVEVVVGNVGPQARFDVRCDDGRCRFDATASADDDGTVAAHRWEFGDGHTASGAVVDHTFTSDGEHQVALTVRDDDGATGSTTQRIEITGAEASSQDPDDDPSSIGGADRGTQHHEVHDRILEMLAIPLLPAVAIITIAIAASITIGAVLGWRKRRDRNEGHDPERSS